MKKILISFTMFLSIFSFSARNLDVNLETVDNKVIKLSDFKGKPTYIKLWASWCPICLNTLAETDEFFAEQDKTFNKITVVFPKYAGEKNQSDFITWFNTLEHKHIKLYFNNRHDLAIKLRIRGFPANVFVNSKGEIELVRFGHMTKKEIRDKISQLN